MSPDSDSTTDLLAPPNGFVFSVRQWARAFRLNQLAIGLKEPAPREKYAAGEPAAKSAAGPGACEMDMVTARGRTGLIASGGELLAVAMAAYAPGDLRHDACAHKCGITSEEPEHLLPRKSTMLADDDGPGDTF